jgi:hypothetical protein
MLIEQPARVTADKGQNPCHFRSWLLLGDQVPSVRDRCSFHRDHDAVELLTHARVAVLFVQRQQRYAEHAAAQRLKRLMCCAQAVAVPVKSTVHPAPGMNPVSENQDEVGCNLQARRTANQPRWSASSAPSGVSSALDKA